jgi:hypothetical protein
MWYTDMTTSHTSLISTPLPEAVPVTILSETTPNVQKHQNVVQLRAASDG